MNRSAVHDDDCRFAQRDRRTLSSADGAAPDGERCGLCAARLDAMHWPRPSVADAEATASAILTRGAA